METTSGPRIDLDEQVAKLSEQGKKLESIVIPWLEQNNPFNMTEKGFLQLLDFVLETNRLSYKHYDLLKEMRKKQ